MRFFLRSFTLGSFVLATASCGLLFGEREGVGGGGGSGGSGAGDPFCSRVGDSPFAAFRGLLVADVEPLGERQVQFVGCAADLAEGIPDVPDGASLVLGSLNEENLCGLQTSFLGGCQEGAAARFSVGGDEPLLAWTRTDTAKRSYLCVDTPENARSSPLDDTGCPSGARVACVSAKSSFSRPSAVVLGGSLFATAQVQDPSSEIACKMNGQDVSLNGQGQGARTLALRFGFSGPEAGVVPAVGVALAGTPDAQLRVTGICLGGGTCPARAPFAFVGPSMSTVMTAEPVFGGSWLSSDDGFQEEATENRSIFPTRFGWAAWLFLPPGTEGFAVAVGDEAPAEPQIQFAVGTEVDPHYIWFNSVSGGGEDGPFLVGGDGTGSFPGVECADCGVRFGFVGEMSGGASALERARVLPVAGNEGCSFSSVTSVRRLGNDGTVLVSGHYFCGRLDLGPDSGSTPDADVTGFGYLYKTKLP